MDDYVINAIALILIKSIGDKTYKSLIDDFGTAKDVSLASRKQLKERSKLCNSTIEDILDKNCWEQAMEVWKKHTHQGVYIIPYEAKNYPLQLKNIYAPPPLLYATRDINFNEREFISIVGTRNATPYGKNFIEKFIDDLAIYDPIVVSGLAYGIDICVHKKALSANLSTIAVVAGGLDMIYPVAHKNKVH